MKKLELNVLVGLPASGKSTWVKEKLKSDTEYVVLSSDDYIQAVATELGRTYNDVFKEHISPANKDLQVKLREAIKDGKNIIWDQTNMTMRKRKAILSHFKKDIYTLNAIIFEVDEDVLTERLDARSKLEGKTIPSFVIDNMRSGYHVPTVNEGFDNIIINN